MAEKIIREGRNVKRIREMLGIKQDALAFDLGISQQAISLLEQREKIDEKMLGDLAKILKVPAEAIKNYNEEAAISIVANNFSDFKDNAHASAMNYYCSFNPLDKMVELYEALLKSEREKNALLERMLDKK